MTSYSTVAKNTTTHTEVQRLASVIGAGTPMGLLLSLTYAEPIGLTAYSTVSQNSTSYTTVSKN